jgi:hypothetical protein
VNLGAGGNIWLNWEPILNLVVDNEGGGGYGMDADEISLGNGKELGDSVAA